MQCPRCGAEATEGKKFCKLCGTPLESSASEVGIAKTVPTPESRCPNCGSPVNPGKSFCSRCGNRIGTVLQAQVPLQPQTARLHVAKASPRAPINWKRVAVVVGVPVVVVCAAFTGWRFWPRVPLPPDNPISVLDRAGSGQVLAFNYGASDRKKLLLMSGNDVWEIPSGVPYEKVPSQAVALSPEGRRVLSYGDVFNLDSKTTTRLQNPDPQWMNVQSRDPQSTNVSTATIPIRFNQVEFSNAGALIAVSRQDGSLYLFDSTTGQVVHTLRQGINTVPPGGRPCNVISMQFSPDGGVLASGEMNGDVNLWSTSTGDLLGTLPSPDNEVCDQSRQQLPTPDSLVRGLGFSQDGKLLASIDGFGILRLWNVGSHSVVRTLPFHLPNGESEVKFSPDGHFLVSSGSTPEGEMLLVWDAAQGQLLRGMAVSGAGVFDFTPGGDLVVAESNAGRVKVQLWKMDTRLSVPFISRRTSSSAVTDSALIQDYEDQALNHLALLQDRLGTYLSKGKGTFPHTLDELAADSPFGKRLLLKKELYGYRYVYTPGTADAQGNIVAYTIAANPLVYQHTGTRSFQLEQSGQVHAIAQNRQAALSDPVVRSLTDATQMAVNAQPIQAADSAAQAGGVQSVSNATQSPMVKPSVQSTAEADQWISRAENQFQQSDYRGALQSCDTALRIDPNNVKAARLKTKVQETMKILGKD